MKRHQDCGGILSNSWCEMHEIRIWIWLVSTYVVCERLSVMHKQVSGWTVNFCPNSPESPFLEFQTRKPMKNFRFEMTKFNSKIPPSPQWKTSDLRWPKFTPKYPPMKNFRFEMTKVYSEIPPQKWKTSDLRWPNLTPKYPPPPQWKTSDLRWPKFTPKYPPNENFRFEMTKVYSEIPPKKWKTSDLRWPNLTPKYPPPPNEKLQIWDDQSLLWNTPPMKNFRFEMTKFNSKISPKWKTSDLRWPKFTPKYPPLPPNEKLQIWDDQSLLWNTPPNEKLQIWDDQSLLRNTAPPGKACNPGDRMWRLICIPRGYHSFQYWTVLPTPSGFFMLLIETCCWILYAKVW